MKKTICLVITLFVIYYTSIIADSDLKVLVTIRPYHSILSAVMKGISEPKLLLQGNESPHNYNLKPSSAEYIKDSDIIFWGGLSLETYLAKSIDLFANRTKVISFIEMEEILLLRVPNYKKKEKIRKFLRNKNSKKIIDNYFGVDPHIWLDPINAKIIVNETVDILSQMDSKNSNKYFKNGENFKLILDELDNELSIKLHSVSSIPFLVFHNAFQYFENRYKLNIVGAFTTNTSFGMSARRMREIQKTIKKKKIPCIFVEQNMSQKLLSTAVEGTNARIGILDPLGVKIKKGPKLYAKLLSNISDSIIECLSGNKK